MTFYQELQLSSVGSKQLIKNTTDPKEKRRHILIYNFKVYLVMAFCVAVVTLYSKLTGNDNSVVGVTVLLAMLVLRQALILSIQNNMLISRLYPVYTPEMLRNSFFVCLLCTHLCARKKRHLNDVSIFLCYAIHLSFFCFIFAVYVRF